MKGARIFFSVGASRAAWLRSSGSTIAMREAMTSKSHHDSGERGRVKDPEHDGRLKENREAGHTKGTTPGSEARREEAGRSGGQSMGSHGGHSGSSQHHGGSGSGGADDLKEREYRDKDGNIHHHTRTSAAMQHKK
jgi:hypothetical protein